MVKDSSVTITINLILTLSLLLLLVFCGNAVLWKVMEKSGKNIRIFPQLTHNTWKSRQKRPTFPHYHKTFSLRSLKCGKTRYLNSKIKDFAKTLKRSLSVSTQFVFFHMPTISGYFYYSNCNCNCRSEKKKKEKKKNAKNLKSFNEMTFILRSFMVYKNGNYNCRRSGIIIVADQRFSLYFGNIVNPSSFDKKRHTGNMTPEQEIPLLIEYIKGTSLFIDVLCG